MERILPFPIPNSSSAESTPTGDVYLRRQHLWLRAELAQQIFGDEQQVYAVYYANIKTLLLAPMSDTMFRQAHECAMIMLKTRSAAGDRSLTLQEFFLDHDIDDSDRELAFNWAPGIQMLQVTLA
ncbi:MAG: hypothetical protein H6555_02675 [Lewinellaceae bacterium]|nr:hypothetical protein [Lewinellaceae bacterium]